MAVPGVKLVLQQLEMIGRERNRDERLPLCLSFHITATTILRRKARYKCSMPLPGSVYGMFVCISRELSFIGHMEYDRRDICMQGIRVRMAPTLKKLPKQRLVGICFAQG